MVLMPPFWSKQNLFSTRSLFSFKENLMTK